MGNCYPKEYLEKFEVFEQQWSTDKYQDAKQRCHQRARGLRKHGWIVKTEKLNFVDLARCYCYSLHAERERKRCPTDGTPLVSVYFMGDILERDFLDCPKCHIAFDPETLKPIAYVIS